MPTATDLVTDLPADFEVFGQAVATSMADLLGGTTGQVLAKNSNTDMDFVWTTANPGDITGVTAGTGISGGGTSGTVTITNSMATEIAAKGDLIVGTGSATFDNLTAGTNGETLVADSSTSTGLRYTAGNPISNPVINSAFQIAQRGTSFSTASAAYTLDRWYALAASAGTVSRQVTGDTTNLPNIQYCARFQRTAGSTSTTGFSLSNSFETVNSIPYAGKTVTFSFYARAGANYSPTSSAFGSRVWTGTGTDQAIQGTYTGGAFTINNTATLTTTWQRFSYSGALPAATTEMAIQFFCDPTGTAGANDYFEVTGVQIDIGSVALPFRTNGATIQGELSAAQRYYWRFTGGNGNYAAYGTGLAGSTTQCDVFVQFPTTMRIKPTTLEFSTLALGDGSATAAVSTLTVLRSNELGATLAAGATGLTQFRAHQLLNNNNSTTAFLGVTAEL